jgi:UDP-N-acetylmuramoyl-tripeptide--D-alanyl-D-alanine ligase
VTTAASIVLAVAAAAALCGRLHVLLHVLQQEHYESARLRIWLRRDPSRLELPTSLLLAGWGIGAAALTLAAGLAGVALAGAGLLYTAARSVSIWRRDQITPLVFTQRARRLFAVAWIGPAALVVVIVVLAPGGAAAPIAGAAVGVEYALAPALLVVANRLLRPIQRRETARFVRSARVRLDEVAPLVVGITGSYGKTTTKVAVAAVAAAKGPAFPTPASFNSYLGVVRAINEGLRDDHQSFVVEMGAYREGDVAELCELVHPTIGVLTAIGPAHLERFGSLDVIERAKGELAEAIPPAGVFITRADDERCHRVADTRAVAQVLLFSPTPHPDAHVWAEDIQIVSGRTQFTLRSRRLGDDAKRTIRARLLGTHNVANLMAATAVGLSVGLTASQIAQALSRVEPPAHRLAPIVNTAAGIVVIDDSYNANPTGAAAALEVLRAHPAERRILITPGMVELGAEAEMANRAFGRLAAEVCDLCLLSGPNAVDVRDGLLEGGFGEEHIVVLPDGRSAHRKLAELTRRGDVILFENDLPDVYI